MSNPHESVQRQPTGARRVGTDFEGGEENRRESAMPVQDAQTNTHYAARPAGQPNVFSKPLGSYRPVAAMDAPSKQFDAAMFQRARQRR